MARKKPNGGGNRKPKKSTSWSDRILQQMGDLRGVRLDVSRKDNDIRDLVGDDRTTPYHIAFDNQSKPITILSRRENIIENISLVGAIHQIIGDFLGYYDFEDCFEDFSWEFSLL